MQENTKYKIIYTDQKIFADAINSRGYIIRGRSDYENAARFMRTCSLRTSASWLREVLFCIVIGSRMLYACLRVKVAARSDKWQKTVRDSCTNIGRRFRRDPCLTQLSSNISRTWKTLHFSETGTKSTAIKELFIS